MTQMTDAAAGKSAPKRGGKRPGQGRPSEAMKQLKELAQTEGKSVEQLMVEVHQGFLGGLRTIGGAMPQILQSMCAKAMRGDEDAQKFLTQLYFKYANAAPSQAHVSPLTTLVQSMNVTIMEAQKRGIIPASTIVEGATQAPGD